MGSVQAVVDSVGVVVTVVALGLATASVVRRRPVYLVGATRGSMTTRQYVVLMLAVGGSGLLSTIQDLAHLSDGVTGLVLGGASTGLAVTAAVIAVRTAGLLRP